MPQFPTLEIIGEPRTEGSLAVVPPRGAECPVCHQRAGRAFARHEPTLNLRRWRAKVIEGLAPWGRPLLASPCYLTASFACSRGGEGHANERDLDKLLRAILDSMGPKGAGILADDRHIAFVAAVKHHLSAARPRAGVILEFGPLTAQEVPHLVTAEFCRRELADPYTLASMYTGPKPSSRPRAPKSPVRPGPRGFSFPVARRLN